MLQVNQRSELISSILVITVATGVQWWCNWDPRKTNKKCDRFSPESICAVWKTRNCKCFISVKICLRRKGTFQAQIFPFERFIWKSARHTTTIQKRELDRNQVASDAQWKHPAAGRNPNNMHISFILKLKSRPSAGCRTHCSHFYASFTLSESFHLRQNKKENKKNNISDIAHWMFSENISASAAHTWPHLTHSLHADRFSAGCQNTLRRGGIKNKRDASSKQPPNVNSQKKKRKKNSVWVKSLLTNTFQTETPLKLQPTRPLRSNVEYLAWFVIYILVKD